jgi:transposase
MENQCQLNIYEGQNWHKYNLAKTQEKRVFYELLNELCQLIPEEVHDKGRKPIPIKDMIFISALKLYNGFSLRKIDHDIREAEKCGYIKKKPHYNRISEFFNHPLTYLLLQKLITITALPLKELEDDFSMDASGFGSYQYERWMRTRFYSPKTEWRNYVKGHVCIGTRTNIICSAEITYGNMSDAKQAPKLLEQLNGNFNPKTISADKGYSSRYIMQLIDSIGAQPFIAFKNNANPSADSPVIWKRMFKYFQNHKELFLKNYHKRSNVETVFAMVKLRLGEFLKSKNYEAQRNELLMKFLVHNICCLVQEIFERGVKVDFKESSKLYVIPEAIHVAPKPEKPIGDLIIPDRE